MKRRKRIRKALALALAAGALTTAGTAQLVT
jgi:hypothetical protein